MRKNPWTLIVVFIFIFCGLFYYLTKPSYNSVDGDALNVTKKNAVLLLKLEGVIADEDRFLKQLKKYRKDDQVKAIVININSPGGVVGPSQEIYSEILRTREEFKKHVVVSSSTLNASGAYYASVAAEQIIVNEGTLMGSIGVIMEFANLEKLYDWARVSRYSITSGKFKDSGAEYRAMREDERKLFQDLINDVYSQFKSAVAKGRNLKEDYVAQYADGRILTGAQAVKLKFADKIGTLDDAFKVAAELSGLKEGDYEVVEPPKRRGSLWHLLNQEDGDWEGKFEGSMKRLLGAQLLNRPLYLMPGHWL